MMEMVGVSGRPAEPSRASLDDRILAEVRRNLGGRPRLAQLFDVIVEHRDRTTAAHYTIRPDAPVRCGVRPVPGHGDRARQPRGDRRVPATAGVGSRRPAARAGARVTLAEAVAPTHRHPGIESATANNVADPVLSMFDRTKDLVRKALRDRAGG
jgi:hypothetical protein